MVQGFGRHEEVVVVEDELSHTPPAVEVGHLVSDLPGIALAETPARRQGVQHVVDALAADDVGAAQHSLEAIAAGGDRAP
jgi:hypothetical protein